MAMVISSKNHKPHLTPKTMTSLMDIMVILDATFSCKKRRSKVEKNVEKHFAQVKNNVRRPFLFFAKKVFPNNKVFVRVCESVREE